MPRIKRFVDGWVDGLYATLSIFTDSIKLTHGDEVYVYDLEGRPIFMYMDYMLYERGLSGEIVEKKWLSFKPPRRHIRRILDGRERRAILERALEKSRYLIERLDWAGDGLDTEIGPGILDKLSREESRFKQIYKPISILPPDQYLSLVFQPLEGCPYNKCSFCTFYRDREFRFKDVEEFRRHVRDVVKLLGRGLLLRRKIFLADANALFADTELLTEYIGVIRSFMPWGYEGIYSFSDYFTVYKSEEELLHLRNLGYRRVYIGLESGDDEVLKILSKPGPAVRSVELVRRLKKAGIDVGVIILIGAGGREYYRRHVENTVKIVNMMPLDNRDIIYFSKLKVRPGSEYYFLAREHGITDLTEEEMDMQIAEIQRGLSHSSRPVYAIYDIDETIY